MFLAEIRILLSMKQIFYKTVRSDYGSVWARGPLSRKYFVGHRYKFPKSRPTHVFTAYEVGANPNIPSEIYDRRKEYYGGNRVLVCYGEVIEQKVPCFDINSSCWDFRGAWVPMCDRETCRDFLVIDEIPLPEFYHGVRPEEDNFNRCHSKVTLPPNPIKKKV